MRKAARKGVGVGREDTSVGLARDQSSASLTREDSLFEDAGDQQRQDSATIPSDKTPIKGVSGSGFGTAEKAQQRPSKRPADEVPLWEPGEDEEEALLLAAAEDMDVTSSRSAHAKKTEPRSSASANAKEGLSEGMAAALAKLRKE